MLAIKPESTLIYRLGTLLLDCNHIYKTSDAIVKRVMDGMEYVDDGIGGYSLRNLYDSRRTVHVGAEIRQLMRAVTKGIFLISEQYNEMSQIEKTLSNLEVIAVGKVADSKTISHFLSRIKGNHDPTDISKEFFVRDD